MDDAMLQANASQAPMARTAVSRAPGLVWKKFGVITTPSCREPRGKSAFSDLSQTSENSIAGVQGGILPDPRIATPLLHSSSSSHFLSTCPLSPAGTRWPFSSFDELPVHRLWRSWPTYEPDSRRSVHQLMSATAVIQFASSQVRLASPSNTSSRQV